MLCRTLPFLLLTFLPSCSLLFDTSDLRGDGEMADSGAMGAPPDAGGEPPGCVAEALDAVEGATVPVILTGEGFGQETEVRASIAGMPLSPEDIEYNLAGTKIGMVLRIPVMTELGEGDDQDLIITAEPAGKPCTAALAVEWLEELDELDIQGPTFSVAALLADGGSEYRRFSSITVSSEVTVTGTAAARFVATNAIRINAPLHADGQDASGTTGGAGGPGSCAGGNEAEAGACGAGGGGAGGSGTPASGGGGGNCAVMTSNDGAGANGGAGGDTSCSEPLVPLGLAGNHGNGGGGGGSASSEARGGGGGGGGGVVELTAPLIVLNASVTTNGGLGGPGECVDSTNAGGSGGGGSGGPIIVRGRQISAAQAEPLEARGGKRGESCIFGGSGSRGRIRVDAADGTLPDMLVASTAGFTWRGPMLAPETPRVVNDELLFARVVGDPTITYQVRVDTGTSAEEVVGGGLAMVTLQSGLNTVCAMVIDVDPTLPEAKNCLTVAFVD